MNVFIRIEVLGRELQGRLLLALAAAERGHRAVVWNKETAYRLAAVPDALPPGVFHDNSPGQEGGKTVLHETLAGRGWMITGQDEEHGLLTDDFAKEMGGRFPPRPMANKAAMFAFGPFDADGIRADCPQYADRVITTGSPRIDFWRRDMAGYFDALGSPSDDLEGPYLLFLMSFSPYRGPFRDEMPRMVFTGAAGSEAELMRRVDDLEAGGLDPHLVGCYRRVVHAKLAVEEIARRNPDVTIVHRTHPHEFVQAWRDVFADAPGNVRVVRDNSVSPWIRNARGIVFSGSTVGYEAAFSGLPVVCFQPDGYDATPGVSRMGHRATTVDEVVTLADAILAGQEPALPADRAEGMRRTLESRFFAMDGPLAADRIVDAWERLAPDTVRSAPPVDRRHLRPRPTPRTLARTARDVVVQTLRLESTERQQQRLAARELLDLKFPPFDLEEIQRIHRALVTSLGRFSGVEITRVGPRVLHLARR